MRFIPYNRIHLIAGVYMSLSLTCCLVATGSAERPSVITMAILGTPGRSMVKPFVRNSSRAAPRKVLLDFVTWSRSCKIGSLHKFSIYSSFLNVNKYKRNIKRHIVLVMIFYKT